jgi:sugar phosphate isomerase/epimerase
MMPQDQVPSGDDDDFRFGVSQFTTMPWSFDEDVAAYAALGIPCIELCESKLDMARDREQLASVAAAGLTATSFQGRFHSLFPTVDSPNPSDPHQRMELFRRSIQRYAGAMPDAVFVTITGAIPDGDFADAHRIAAREYRLLAEVAQDCGVRLAVEPLNPLHMNTHSFIHSLPQAQSIAEAVDHRDFGVWLDVWHVWQDGGVMAQIGRLGDRLFGVHLNDWHLPRRPEDRISIGTGSIPLPELVRSIHDAGYRGAYTLELFSDLALADSLWKQDLTALLKTNQQGFRRICAEAMAV